VHACARACAYVCVRVCLSECAFLQARVCVSVRRRKATPCGCERLRVCMRVGVDVGRSRCTRHCACTLALVLYAFQASAVEIAHRGHLYTQFLPHIRARGRYRAPLETEQTLRTISMRWSHSSSDKKPFNKNARGDQDKCWTSPRHSSCVQASALRDSHGRRRI